MTKIAALIVRKTWQIGADALLIAVGVKATTSDIALPPAVFGLRHSDFARPHVPRRHGTSGTPSAAAADRASTNNRSLNRLR